MNYLDNIDNKIKEYFNVLESEFPEWLIDYINTKELLQQQYISITCGTIYSDLFDSHFFFSSLDHSIAVALIIWHFTKDKKQTLSGLFHDIATPVFKHCVDFLNGDYMSQESTEDLTTEIILNSKEIMSLLNDINRRGTTVVVATHAKEIVDKMQKRVIAIENGTVCSDIKKGVYSNEHKYN